MEGDKVQKQPCKKLPRLSNGSESQNNDQNDGINRIHGWNPSSRIIRVSRASGGKDRHSKVLTSKGLRDRRVRLSVSTAIQFYDLQDRLGCDQPSKAVEWLIKTAADAIADLPSINTPFPDAVLNNEKIACNGGRTQQEIGFSDFVGHNQNQTVSLSKSACSSNSETSKTSSALSLSRSEIRGSNRVKARERARERASKEKEKERENSIAHCRDIQENSFTKLLTTGFGGNHQADGTETGSGHQNPNPSRQWNASAPVEYNFSPVVLASSSSSTSTRQGYNGQNHHPGNFLPQTMLIPSPAFSISGDNHHHHHPQEALHQFSLVPETLIQAAASGGDYNTLNFSISSSGTGLAGFNRGTLQSNAHALYLNSNNIQRFPSSSMEGQSLPFLMAAPPLDNHHHHHQQFPGGLQLYYKDGNRFSDNKDKGKG